MGDLGSRRGGKLFRYYEDNVAFTLSPFNPFFLLKDCRLKERKVDPSCTPSFMQKGTGEEKEENKTECMGAVACI